MRLGLARFTYPGSLCIYKTVCFLVDQHLSEEYSEQKKTWQKRKSKYGQEQKGAKVGEGLFVAEASGKMNKVLESSK